MKPHPYLDDGNYAFYEKQIDEAFFNLRLPDYMKKGVKQYVFDGYRAGDFLNGVLENSLFRASMSADSSNFRYMGEWGKLLLSLPPGSWGSEDIVNTWLHGFAKMRKEQDA